MPKRLVIVESPAKAKTIKKYLGDDYLVSSSYGHVRDLPSGGLNIDIENDFTPNYVVTDDKKKVVKELKDLAKQADEVLLATDEDREGEAISWHLCHILGLDPYKAKRITYTEVTKDAILKAVNNPRPLNIDLVNAQQARRVLDRLVGYKLSPVLWKKVKPSLSAGRVQSVSVRLIVEREKEIINFKSESYFKVTALFNVKDDRGANVSLKADCSHRFKSHESALAFVNECNKSAFEVASVDKRPGKKTPAQPFTTSTLQQEASRKLGFSVSRTMIVAQKLYEAGLITYMRTDSVNLSESAIKAAADEIGARYGAEYVKSRRYATKDENAQEAHEAIRPSYMDRDNCGDNRDEERLYDLIWKRTIASQMAEAKIERTTVKIDISESEQQLTAKGEVLLFDGFLKVYREGTDDEEETEEAGLLPPLSVGQQLDLDVLTATQRFSKHPPRYAEASLVKKLEELGIGRPSTYAPTISTIQKRNYVVKEVREGKEREYAQITLKDGQIEEATKTEITGAEKNKLFPTDIGMLVNDFLVENFKTIMDYSFTANIEKDFDEIADGKIDWNKMISEFYEPFNQNVDHTTETAERVTGERALGDDPKSGEPIIARMGKFGPMVQMGVQTEEKKPRYAKLLPTQSITTIGLDEALELFKLPRELGEYEETMVKANIGRFGPYVQLGKLFASIPKDTYDPYTITYDQAVELIEAKREADRKKFIKAWEEEDIQLLNGRWGPYIKHGKKNVRLPKDIEKPEELSLEEVQTIIKEAPAKKKRAPRKKK